jgi:alkylated DNA repair dioxygenase AlkB
MELFDIKPKDLKNLLPKDGMVCYYGKVLSPLEAQTYFDVLNQGIEWKNDEAIIFGKHIITKRKAAWYADEPFKYTYSKITKKALPWTKELLKLKSLVEQQSQESYNSCLLNLYHDGNEAMSWHSDDEHNLKQNAAIASLSLGAERKFAFKHKQSKEVLSLVLEQGSLLIMKNETQRHWLHRLTPSKLIKDARINLTFRTIVP